MILSLVTHEILMKHIITLTKVEMKDLDQTKFCLGLQLEHSFTRTLVYQSAYIQKMLEKFNIDKSHSSKTLMVIRSL